MIEYRKQIIIIQTRRHIIRRTRRTTTSRCRSDNEVLTNHRARLTVKRERGDIPAHGVRIRCVDSRGGVEERARGTYADGFAAVSAACVGREDTPRIPSESCCTSRVIDGELKDFAGVFAHGVGV